MGWDAGKVLAKEQRKPEKVRQSQSPVYRFSPWSSHKNGWTLSLCMGESEMGKRRDPEEQNSSRFLLWLNY